ncbi:MAG TPA: succinylglutamate desuccinylase/aspartoacylase family protein [Saprospiraceae bacterium]|nr:succinylglutamate desuccinylase/aspartoacylase family protein [Saprospiraceae bacterium]HMQ83416.1 succinylglutamate desuccinylase/aspartoacylase family protein [Saprospiraceae bacterium]
MEENLLTIHNIAIAAGQKEIVKIPVGRLPSGNQIRIQAHVFRAVQPGPTMLVLAGVHGDEINGVEIVRRALQQDYFEHLTAGSVIVIPILNLYGFLNYSRDVPDGKDVNRSFPGSLNGSLASRVARTLVNKILPHIDFCIDFHTGGNGHYNYPQIRFSKGDTASEELARAFGAPFLIEKPPLPHSLRKTCLEMHKPIIVFEGGENFRYDGLSIEKGLLGLKRILLHKGMISQPVDIVSQPVVFRKSSWIRTPRAGMFLWIKNSGHQIHKGEVLGIINDPYGQEYTKVKASRDAYIIGHNNAPLVNQGDALFHIAWHADDDGSSEAEE